MSVSRMMLATALATLLGIGGVERASAAATEVSVAAPSAATVVPFSVYFPLTHTAQLQQFLADVVDPTKPATYHHWLTPAQFKAAYGPDPSAVAQVKAALAAAGMSVTAEHSQSLDVKGPASAVQAMFGMHLNTMRATDTGHQRFVAAEGHATLPSVFTAAGAHVLGFEPHITAHTHSRRVDNADQLPTARRNIGPTQGYFANDMKAAYSFPSFQTMSAGTGLPAPQQIVGLGTNIGILMSSIALNSDLALAFNSTSGSGASLLVQNYSGNTVLPVPTFTIREVSGGSGPFGNSAADEASLDTQMSLTTAPGASEQLYDIPDLSDASILAGYTAIVEDNTVDVVSSSFGGCEFPEVVPNPFNGFVSEGWVFTIEEQIFEQGNAQGITFVASSGDEGSLPCPTDASATGYYNGGLSPAAPGVEEPAAAPSVTAVGGTNLQTTTPASALEDTYVGENANGDPLISPFDIFGICSIPQCGMTGGYWGSGGGVSQFYAKPAYQNLVETGNATQRTVPDISLQMGGCPGGITGNPTFCNAQLRSFTEVFIGGTRSGLIGTSSSSPQFAGVVALMIQLAGGGSGANPPGPNQPNAPMGRLGNINPLIYSLAAKQIVAGGPNAPPNQQYFNRQIQGFAGDGVASTAMPYSTLLGVGTPNVTNLLGLQGAAPAGNPGTPSNP